MISGQISKLSLDSQNFISSAASSGATRSLAFSIAISRAIANKLPMPSSKVEDLGNYFSMTLKVDALSTINVLNEIFVIDCEKVTELVENFYSLRYSNLFPDEYFFATKEMPLSGFFSMQKYLPDVVIDEIAKNISVISVYYGNINKLLNELKQ
jgi:hypothetical protein